MRVFFWFLILVCGVVSFPFVSGFEFTQTQAWIYWISACVLIGGALYFIYDEVAGTLLYFVGGERSVMKRHERVIISLYSFCPRCFEANIECAIHDEKQLFRWYCPHCEYIGPENKRSPLAALLCWHHEHYSKNVLNKLREHDD